MTQLPSRGAGVERVAVVGAGMVGLSTAWFLQEHSREVSVIEARAPGAGASEGNAGWVSPGLTAPLPDPHLLAYGLRAMFSPGSPVRVPLRPDGQLLRFLGAFARNSTHRRWRESLSAFVPLSRAALAAFDELVDGGVDGRLLPSEPLLACFRTGRERDVFAGELARMEEAGLPLSHERVDDDAAHATEPLLTPEVRSAVRISGQCYLDPGRFIGSLAQAVVDRGARMRVPTAVQDLHDDGRQVHVSTDDGERRTYDHVVIATGAWLPHLARPFGVRHPLQAGRGYSFSVPVEQPPSGPIYLHAERIACTPLDGRLRMAGVMEFRRPDAPLDSDRITAMVESARPLLRGVDVDDRRDEWVGSRPVTADGLPLIGPTRSPRVHVAGGHGMWGIVLGPVTGQLLAASLATGSASPELAPFDPLRR